MGPFDMNRTVVDAGARANASGMAMPFALVAIEEVSQLHRLLDGSVLAASGGALHRLDREGGVQSLDRVFFALKEALGDLGNVGGTWPGTLARLGPSGWRRIPIATPVLRIDTGSDGTTWAICGSDGYASTDQSVLARVTLTADGGVRFDPLPLALDPRWSLLDAQVPSSLQGCKKLLPRELAVISEKDLWLTAQCLSGQDYAPTVLLHTQVQKPLVIFKTFERHPAGVR